MEVAAKTRGRGRPRKTDYSTPAAYTPDLNVGEKLTLQVPGELPVQHLDSVGPTDSLSTGEVLAASATTYVEDAPPVFTQPVRAYIPMPQEEALGIPLPDQLFPSPNFSSRTALELAAGRKAVSRERAERVKPEKEDDTVGNRDPSYMPGFDVPGKPFEG